MKKFLSMIVLFALVVITGNLLAQDNDYGDPCIYERPVDCYECSMQQTGWTIGTIGLFPVLQPVYEEVCQINTYDACDGCP